MKSLRATFSTVGTFNKIALFACCIFLIVIVCWALYTSAQKHFLSNSGLARLRKTPDFQRHIETYWVSCKRSWRLSAVIPLDKKLQLQYLTGFWIKLCIARISVNPVLHCDFITPCFFSEKTFSHVYPGCSCLFLVTPKYFLQKRDYFWKSIFHH